MWNFRPSAYMNGYATESVQSLLELYRKDNQRAHDEGVHVPPRTAAVALRTCQWNVHYFANFLEQEGRYSDGPQLAAAVVDTLLELDADVIVLNEVGASSLGHHHESEAGRNCAIRLLQCHGYQVHVADCFCPTAIATRLPVEGCNEFSLDMMRAAVGVQVRVEHVKQHDNIPANSNNKQHTNTTTAKNQNDSHVLWVYGTHLEDSDDSNGKYRLAELKCLLETIGVSTPNVMLMGDFNQQRRQDYTTDEWQKIVENKQRRQSPLDDGVARLLRAVGYACMWDKKRWASSLTTNWNQRQHHPPPSTHWSGTIVDYTYIKDDHLQLVGVYVSPSDLSDHRLIVCDWKLTRGDGGGLEADGNRGGAGGAGWLVGKSPPVPLV